MGCQYDEPQDGCACTFTVQMPRLTFGRGCLAEVGARARLNGLSRVVVFTDDWLRQQALFAAAMTALADAGVEAEIYSNIRIEPCDQTVADAAAFRKDTNVDGIISIGGGSVIDTAKAALLVATHGGPVNRYFAAPMGDGAPVPGPLPPHLACPTTSGTGSECTSVAVIRLLEYNTKFVIGSPHMMPVDAIVDPACTDSLPANAVTSTGFDLLCHAAECYTAKAYTAHALIDDPGARQLLQGANPWSELAARRALEIAGAYLPRGVADHNDHEARDQLMWGATLAGMAFGNSGTHMPHAMSYGITHLMQDITTRDYREASPFVPHGISVAVTAPAVFRYTAAGDPTRHMDVASLLGADTSQAAPDDAGEMLAGRIIELMQSTGAPNGLAGVGFGEADATRLADSSVRQGRAIANAPRVAEHGDLIDIYRDAVSYW